jgi:PadR family transcriptional regulator, regulatory protein PadR
MKLLGSTEELIMLAIIALPKEDASGVAIRQIIQERTGKDISVGALYTTLHRLEQKGMITSMEVAGDENRRGIPKSVYSLLGAGQRALDETDYAKNAMRGLGYA